MAGQIKIEDGRINKIAANEGFLSTINPNTFSSVYEGTIKTGQQLQKLGEQGVDLVIAEQKVFNSTQVDMLNVERQLKMGAFLNNTRNGGNPQFLEQDYHTAFKQINKDIIKKAPNDLIKNTLRRDGEAYFASNFPSIQAESRVHRLNKLKTGIKGNVASIVGSMTDEMGALAKQEAMVSIETLYRNAVNNNIMQPSEAYDGLLKIDKDQEAAFIRKQMDAATSAISFDLALANTIHMGKETKEMRRDQFRTRLRQKKDYALRKEVFEAKQAKDERELREKKNAAVLLVNVNSPDASKRLPPNVVDDMYLNGDITESVWKTAKQNLNNPAEAATETDGDTYQAIQDLINNEGWAAIDSAGIFRMKHALEDKHVTSLLAQLRSVEDGSLDKEVSKARQKMNDVIGSVDALTRAGKMAGRKERQAYQMEFWDRLDEGENPADIATDILDRFSDAADVTSRTSQTRMNRRLSTIPEQYRTSTNTGVLVIPDTFGMRVKVHNDKSMVVGSESYVEIMDKINNIEETWSKEDQEQHGGTKQAVTKEKENRRREAEKAQEAAIKQDALNQKKAEELQLKLDEEKKQAEIKHQEDMAARKVVEQEERESIAGKKQQIEVDKQMSQISDIARNFNVDPEQLIKAIQPLFKEIGGMKEINKFLGGLNVDSGPSFEDVMEYPDKMILEQLYYFENAKIDGDLSPSQDKAYNSLRQEVKKRKLTPLALG